MKRLLLLFILLITHGVLAQSVYLHTSHDVYDFLKRLEAKHDIGNYRDAVRPLTRQEIARFLIEAEGHADQLTTVERDQLQFYKQEFYVELKQLKYEGEQPEERWHLFPYRSVPATFNVDLVGGYSYGTYPTKKFTRIRSNGLMGYGYLGDFVGTYLYFRDHQEGGTFLDVKKILSPDQGQILIKQSPRNIEYDYVDAQLTFDISFLKLSFEKMPNVWGAGYKGNLILSTKPPSYPQIKLRVKLGKDADFTYIHSWLHSEIVDSVNSYHVPVGLNTVMDRVVYRSKFLAAHILEASVADGVDIAVGESEVYGNRGLELLFLIPVMFFKSAEHYTVDLDNSQIFATADVSALKNYNFYFTLFIDEFSTDEFYRSNRQRNQLGFTIGGRGFDTFYPNTDVLVEYTRTNPWVYNHKFPDVTYQSHNYDLGHWIGQNADYFFVAANYRPMRNLGIGVQFESLRKGGKLPTAYQYRMPTPDFLYGPRIKRQAFGLSGRYEVLRDLFLDSRFLIARYSQEAPSVESFQYPRTGGDYAGRVDFFLGLRYNFQ